MQDVLFVIGGFNGMKPVRAFVAQLLRHGHQARAYPWHNARAAARDIAALAKGTRATLIGHSLGGGQAQRLAQILPAGSIDSLITVAPFAPAALDPASTRQGVRRWLNIMSAPGQRDWQHIARKLAAPLLLGWREQGFIAQACENHPSPHPHQDFYKLISERCGALDQYRSIATDGRAADGASLVSVQSATESWNP
jgi:pimeloyl-ACP methyl ester carboxylesterase